MYTSTQLVAFAKMIPALNEVSLETLNETEVTSILNKEISKLLPAGTDFRADKFTVLENMEEFSNGTGYYDGITSADLSVEGDNRFHVTIHLGMDETRRLVLAFDLGKLGSGCIFQRYTNGQQGVWTSNVPSAIDPMFPGQIDAHGATKLLRGEVKHCFDTAIHRAATKQLEETIKTLKSLGHHKAAWDLRVGSLVDSPSKEVIENPSDLVVIRAGLRFKTLSSEMSEACDASMVAVVKDAEDLLFVNEELADGRIYDYVLLHGNVVDDFHSDNIDIGKHFNAKAVKRTPRMYQ